MKQIKIRNIALMCLSALALTACGGKPTTQDGEYSIVKIAFVEAGFGRQFLLDWEADYNKKHPDDKIKLDLDGDAQMTVNILPRLQNGTNLPDIAMVLQTNWQPWTVNGYLEPLDDLYNTTVEGTSRTVKDSIVEGLQDFGEVKGKYYALPWSVNPCGLVYNASMFEQYKWSVPTTFAELETLCNKINSDSAGTVAPFSWSGAVASYWDFTTLQWWAQYEGREKWNEFWKFESPEVYKQEGRLKALQGFEKLVCGEDGSPKNSIPGAAGKKFMESQMSFVRGEAAMMSNGAWLENEMKSSMPSNFKMRLMKTPTIEGAKEDLLYCTSGDFMVIPRKAANKEVAKKFLAYTCTESALEIFTKSAGGIRPFEYEKNPSTIGGISDFTKDCCLMWEEGKNVYMNSKSIMYYQNSLNTWPGYGAPYSKMIQEGDSAETVHNTIYNFVSNNWSKFQKEAGNFGK